MIDGTDRSILRELAQQVAAEAALPHQAERIRAWKRHNALRPGRPMVLVFPEGAWRELVPDDRLRCRDALARCWERQFRQTLHQATHFLSDNVVTTDFPIAKILRSTGWGLDARWQPSTSAHGAGTFAPVLHTFSDLGRLHHPRIDYDEAETLACLRQAENAFGDLLHVHLSGVTHISYHLMAEFTRLRGLEEALIDMADHPEFVHEAMRFLVEGHRGILRQYQDHGLLQANNDNTYHSTGGNGWSDELRPSGNRPALPSELWASAESQELTVVSPRMHREFAMRYEAELLAPFGLNGYGCCEDLTRKLADVLTLPHLRRVSISPFADIAACTHGLASHRAIVSWKPQPADLVGAFAEDRIRRTLTQGVAHAQANACTLEIILKDTHTCEHQGERFDHWTRICQEVVDAAMDAPCTNAAPA